MLFFPGAYLKDGQRQRMGKFSCVGDYCVTTGPLHTNAGQSVHLGVNPVQLLAYNVWNKQIKNKPIQNQQYQSDSFYIK